MNVQPVDESAKGTGFVEFVSSPTVGLAGDSGMADGRQKVDSEDDLEQKELSRLATDLSVGQTVIKDAWALWNDVAPTVNENIKADRWGWFGVLIYVASIDKRLPYGPNDPQAVIGGLEQPAFTVTQLLDKANISLLEFFRRLKVLREAGMVSDSVQHQVLTLERKYCITCPLYHKYEKMILEIFNFEENAVSNGCLGAEEPCCQEVDSVEYKKRLCWSVFVQYKGDLVKESSELVLAFQLLLCCLDHVMCTTPAFQLKPPFGVVQMSRSENQVDHTMLRQLCETFAASFEEVCTVQSYLEKCLQTLPRNQGLLELAEVEQLYWAQYQQEGDIDELRFLSHDPHLLPQEAVKPAVPEDSGGPPITPVRAALSTVQNLKNLLNKAQNEPSAVLAAYFKGCSVDPTGAIQARIQQAGQRFVQYFAMSFGDQHQEIATQRFNLAVGLYYRVLEALLKLEGERLSLMDFSYLLNNDSLQKCLLACSVEVVMTTYGAPMTVPVYSVDHGSGETSFPWVLEAFNVSAFDFFKVLESFIKAEPKLTKDVVKHLQEVENRILESIAWEAGSPLFTCLEEANSASTPTKAECMHQPNSDTSVPSPMRVRNGSSHQTGQASPRPQAMPQARPKTKHSQSLQLFYNKVCRLGYKRLLELCKELNVSKDLQHKVWTCLEHCITHKPLLLQNRHLDQVMMCSLYGMCKVVDKEIKFKTIVNVYRNMPHASQRVYKSALISDKERDTIIGFYNKVFMHTMRNFLMQFAANRQGVPSLSPVPKPPVSPLTASPVFVLPGRRNFYVSPMRDSSFKPPQSPSQMTPRTKQLYSFGEGVGSSEKLKTINDTMRALQAQGHSPRRAKRLKFEPDEQAEGDGVSSGINPMVMTIKGIPIQSHTKKSLAFDALPAEAGNQDTIDMSDEHQGVAPLAGSSVQS